MGSSPGQADSLCLQDAIDDAADNDPWALAEAVKEFTAICPEMSIKYHGNHVVQKLLSRGESRTHQLQYPFNVIQFISTDIHW